MPKNTSTTKKPKTQPKSKAVKSASSSTQDANQKRLLKRRLQSHRDRKAQARKSHKNITGSFRLFADSASLLRQHWKIFGGILLVYIVLSIVLIGVRGSGLNVGQLKEDMSNSSGNGVEQIGRDLTLYTLIASSSGSTSSESGAAYQSIVLLIVSLATIWALRQVIAGKKIALRDTFYKGMYPLVPVALVVLVMGLQLLPLTVGGFLFGVGFGGGVAVGFLEKALWLIVIFLLAFISLYMLCSSLFAFYVVTLSGMRPMVALRSARQLVRFRRWTIIRKLLFLALALLLLGAALTLPFIWILPAAAQWVFLLLSMVGLVFAHTYLYSLYRELL